MKTKVSKAYSKHSLSKLLEKIRSIFLESLELKKTKNRSEFSKIKKIIDFCRHHYNFSLKDLHCLDSLNLIINNNVNRALADHDPDINRAPLELEYGSYLTLVQLSEIKGSLVDIKSKIEQTLFSEGALSAVKRSYRHQQTDACYDVLQFIRKNKGTIRYRGTHEHNQNLLRILGIAIRNCYVIAMSGGG